MDGNTLQKLFSGPNPFLAQMGEQAFNLDQQKQRQGLEALQGQEQRAQAMHPLQMLNQQATTRLNDSTARINEYKIASTPAPNVRLDQAMKEFHAKSDDLTREQARADIMQRMQRAAAIKANKGAIPAWMQIGPDDMKYYSGPGLDQTIALGEAFLKYDPKEMTKRWDDERSQALKTTVPGKAAGGGGSGGSPKPLKENLQQQLARLNQEIIVARRAGQDTTPIQAEADRVELMMLRAVRDAAAARTAGDPAMPDSVPVRDPGPPQATPAVGNNPKVGASSGSAAQGRTVRMKTKDGKVYEIPAAQVQAAKARGWTE